MSRNDTNMQKNKTIRFEMKEAKDREVGCYRVKMTLPQKKKIIKIKNNFSPVQQSMTVSVWFTSWFWLKTDKKVCYLRPAGNFITFCENKIKR